MRERCVPGSLSPPPREPGHEANIQLIDIIYLMLLIGSNCPGFLAILIVPGTGRLCYVGPR